MGEDESPTQLTESIKSIYVVIEINDHIEHSSSKIWWNLVLYIIFVLMFLNIIGLLQFQLSGNVSCEHHSLVCNKTLSIDLQPERNTPYDA